MGQLCFVRLAMSKLCRGVILPSTRMEQLLLGYDELQGKDVPVVAPLTLQLLQCQQVVRECGRLGGADLHTDLIQHLQHDRA